MTKRPVGGRSSSRAGETRLPGIRGIAAKLAVSLRRLRILLMTSTLSARQVAARLDWHSSRSPSLARPRIWTVFLGCPFLPEKIGFPFRPTHAQWGSVGNRSRERSLHCPTKHAHDVPTPLTAVRSIIRTEKRRKVDSLHCRSRDLWLSIQRIHREAFPDSPVCGDVMEQEPENRCSMGPLKSSCISRFGP